MRVRSPEDSVSLEVPAAGRVIFTIRSPRGIGEATIVPAGGAWPDSVELRLELRGLEGLSVACDTLRLDLSVLSRGDVIRSRRRLGEDGRVVDQALAADDPMWMPVRHDEAAFEVDLPRPLLAACDTLDVQWVDFYRR